MRRVVIVLALAGVAVLLWQMRHLLLLIFGAVLVAVILRAMAGPLHRHGVPDGVSLAIVIISLITVIAGASWLFGSEVSAEVGSLTQSLPEAWRRFEERLGDTALGERLIGMARESAPKGGSGLLSSVGGFLASFGAGLADTVLVLIGGIYLAGNPNLYRRGALKLLPAQRRELVGTSFDDSNRALRLWLKGQLFSMVVVGMLTGAGLWLIGVPSPLALGLLAGLLEFVPLIGPIVAAVPALLLAFAAGGDAALWTVGLFLGVQQIEGNVLQPLVQRWAVELPPALFLFALLGFGSLFGALGIILAAPLTVVVYVMIKRLYVREALETPTPIPGEDRD